MILNTDDVKNIYLCTSSIDFRKQLDGLLQFINAQFDEDILDHSLFVFVSKDKKKIKIIYYDGTGFWMFMKRIEKSKFKVSFEEVIHTRNITSRQLKYLLEGLKMDLVIDKNIPKNHMIL